MIQKTSLKNSQKIILLVLMLILLTAVLMFQSCKKDEADITDNETSTESPVSEAAEENGLPSAAVETENEGSESGFEEGEYPTANPDEEGYELEVKESETSSPIPMTAQINTSGPSDGKFYSYLTGFECTEEEQRRRPVAIMINNIKPALPNIGTSHADIIYECIVEGGQTRLMLVLNDYEKIPVYGSVRSSRDYYIDLLQAHDAIYVHAGGTNMAYEQLRDRQIDRLDGVNPVKGVTFSSTFYRDAERRKTMALEHTLMATGSGIAAGIKQMNYRTTLKDDYKGTLNFYKQLTDMGANGTTANYVCVPYSNGFQPEFIYNPDDGLYYRKQYGAAHIDAGNNWQLRFRNVIVIFADYRSLGMANGYLACELTGTGYGFYISNGKYKVIKWKKDTRDSEYSLYNLNDTDLYINPGKTFISVTSTVYNRSVVINDEIKDYK